MPKQTGCETCEAGGECLPCGGCEAHEGQSCATWCEFYVDDRYETGPEVPSPFEDPVPPGW